MIYRFQIYIYFVDYFKNHGVMVERRSGEVAVPLSAKKNFKRVVPIDMQTAVRGMNTPLLEYRLPPSETTCKSTADTVTQSGGVSRIIV